MSSRIWGIAAGTRTTKNAARGAFTFREYQAGQPIPKEDWLEILFVETPKNLLSKPAPQSFTE